MHGRGSRRNSGQSFGSDGRAVNVWRTSPERLRGATRAAFIGCWRSMEALLPRHAEELLLQAEALLARTLAVDPRHVASLKASAALRRAQGKFEEGIAAAEAVIAENPGEPWAYKEIGLSRMYLGHPLPALGTQAQSSSFVPPFMAAWGVRLAKFRRGPLIPVQG